MRRALRVLAFALLAYVGMVAAFESLLGTIQPAGEGTLVIGTFDQDGTLSDRVVSTLESGGELFVAANHWPRDWYRSALQNPTVRVTLDGVEGTYLAVPATEEEHARVDSEHPLGFVFRFLTGFPPRYFLKLEPA